METYFVFASFWQFKVYYVYGFMLLVSTMLAIMTACVGIGTTYLMVNGEEHRWHWASFAASGSTALYVFLYSIYYYFARTRYM